MRSISQRELRNDSGRILRDLQGGEQFLVTTHGKPVGVLRMDPAPEGPQRFVSAERLRAAYAETPLSPQEAGAWKRDIREGVDDEVDDPWERAFRRREPQA